MIIPKRNKIQTWHSETEPGFD